MAKKKKKEDETRRINRKALLHVTAASPPEIHRPSVGGREPGKTRPDFFLFDLGVGSLGM